MSLDFNTNVIASSRRHTDAKEFHTCQKNDWGASLEICSILTGYSVSYGWLLPLIEYNQFMEMKCTTKSNKC